MLGLISAKKDTDLVPPNKILLQLMFLFILFVQYKHTRLQFFACISSTFYFSSGAGAMVLKIGIQLPSSTIDVD